MAYVNRARKQEIKATWDRNVFQDLANHLGETKDLMNSLMLALKTEDSGNLTLAVLIEMWIAHATQAADKLAEI